jgi:uncharacterized protein (UPF0332 family)
MTAEERKAISVAWIRAGADALHAAGELQAQGHYRSSVSRSYYAAYSYIAAVLVLKPGMNFQDDREGPEHEPLADHIKNFLMRDYTTNALKEMRAGIRVLYDARILADYRPRVAMLNASSLRALKKATAIANMVKK